MKISNHFAVSELVNPDIIKVLGEKRAANTISPFLIKEIERLRVKYGRIKINGGRFTNSGLRQASYYKNKLGFMRKSFSTHQYGNTADLKFLDGAKPSDVYDYIIANPRKFPYIVRMENAHITETWLHIECGQYRDNIEVFNP